MIFDAVQAFIERAMEKKAQRMLVQYGAALEASTKTACPVDTGALQQSIRWTSTGTLSGELRFLDYGLLVNNGHKIASSTRVIVATDVRGRTRTRRVYIKEKAPGGYQRIKRVPANPFLERGAAMASRSVGEPYASAFHKATMHTIAMAKLSPSRRAALAKQGLLS